MGEPTLRLLPPYKRHDLPPKWDGHPVRWAPWLTSPGLTASLACRLPTHERACQKCGLIDAPTTSTFGYVPDQRFLATRCMCGHDTVTDLNTWEQWDLESHDYDDEGSTPDGSLW